MRAFSLFFGLVAGLFLGYCGLSWRLAAVLLFAGFGLLVAKKQKEAGAFLLAFMLGGVVGFIKINPAALSKTTFRGVVIEAKSNYYILQSGLARYYVYEEGNTRQFGDFLEIYGNSKDFVRTSYESQFNFSSYLAGKGVFKEISAYTSSLRFGLPLRLREWELSFLAHFDANTSALLDAILFAHKDYTSSSIALASSLALLTLYSSSGIFYGLYCRAIHHLALLKLSERGALIVELLGASLLLPFDLCKIGILRVYLGLLLRLINVLAFKKRYSYLEILSWSGILLAVIDFHMVYQRGYLLGFGVALVLFFSREWIERKTKRWRPFYSSSLLYAMLLPVSLSSGDGLHVFYPLFSTVSLPLVALFGGLGYLSFLSLPFTHLLSGYATFLNGVLTFFSQLDLKVPLPGFSEAFIVSYYALFIAVRYFADLGYLKVEYGLYFGLLGLYCVSLIPIIPALTDQVSFINVGQGDSIVIRDGFTTVMIDTGGNLKFDMAEETLIPYLRKERIYHIDYLIASHGDFDHIGAKESLMAKYSVGTFINEASSFPLSVGNLYFTNYNVYGGGEENEESLVLSLNFMGYQWLFTGDAPISIEKKIVAAHPELDCDILKLGHHGSDTSSSLEFLQTVTPKVAIVSVGAKNTYGHPSKSVLERLTRLGILIRRTDQEGTITYRKMRSR